jgi:NAD(P)-dependent dehydrogenase (short-subunit alcohol dehydrogenase family)
MSQNDGALAGRVAIVTGASSGIGRAITLALAREGVRICAIGRDSGKLLAVAEEARQHAAVQSFQMDLAVEEQYQPLLEFVKNEGSELHILIHCAGIIQQAPLERASVADLDLQYATNVRAPYILTQRLLSFLLNARGQIVFINSSAGMAVRGPEIGQYAATKHALKAIADSLREEVNARGVRVLSVFLGRTATPLQAVLHEQEGKPYRPERLLQPDDVAALMVHILKLPPTAEVTDVSIRPMLKA